MKKLFLLRHAHAVANSLNEPRMVTEEGYKQCDKVVEFLSNKELPEFILCSTAQRTKDTINYILNKLSLDKSTPIKYSDIIKDAVPANMWHEITNFDNKYNSVLIVSHNPGISILASSLTNNINKGVSNDIRLNGFSPASMALLSFDRDNWSGLSFDEAILEWFFRP
jgi:phosphohistidine phosphatase